MNAAPLERTVEELTLNADGSIIDHLWILDPADVHATAQRLVDVGVLVSAQDVLDFYEKPWHWSPERAGTVT